MSYINPAVKEDLDHLEEEKGANKEDLDLIDHNEQLSLMMTEDGIKRKAGIDYTTKFKEINWTSRIDQELPIRMLVDIERSVSSLEAPE